MSQLKVIINGEEIINYDGSTRLPGRQRDLLDRMDADMNSGVELNGESISNPDLMQRARHVAMNLIMAIQNNKDSLVTIACAYLKNRLPDLQQVVVSDDGEQVSLELIFTENK